MSLLRNIIVSVDQTLGKLVLKGVDDLHKINYIAPKMERNNDLLSPRKGGRF